MQIAVRNWTGIDVDNKGEVFSKTELFYSFLCLLGKHFFLKFGDFWWAEESIRSSKHSKCPEFFENMYLTFRQKKSCFIQNGGTDYYLFYLYVDSDHSCSWHSGAFQHSQLKTFLEKRKTNHSTWFVHVCHGMFFISILLLCFSKVFVYFVGTEKTTRTRYTIF